MRNADSRRVVDREAETIVKTLPRKLAQLGLASRFFSLPSSVFTFLVFFVPLGLALTSFTLVSAEAPPPSPPPAQPSPAAANTYRSPDENEVFAHALLESVTWVGENYVRPVSRVDLLNTALTALYDSARRPVPHDLRQRIERAEKLATAQSATAENMPAPLVPAMAQRRWSHNDDRPVIHLIAAVRTELGRVENLGGGEPLQVGCQAMLRSLDSYSCVLTSRHDRRAIGASPEREGFGLEVAEEDKERVILRDVLPGSPAQQAGLRMGDEILRILDSDGRERNLKESRNLLSGSTPLLKPQFGDFALPEPIAITYRRPGSKGERRATLEWRRFRPESVFGVTRRAENSWDYWLDRERKIAHVRLGALVNGTPLELSDILAELRRNGLRGLILDLRWCPGGDLDGSLKTAELFLGEGTIATVRYRNQPEDVYRSTNEGKHNDFAMVVLINGDTTGGAEMIAAALQDHHRAVVVGQRTHGKGNMQRLLNIGSCALKVTSGTIMRPSGKPLHRFPDSKPNDPWGVQPDSDHELRLSAEVGRMLRKWWEEQTMRPGSSARRLPLDDPLADPQRNVALEALTAIDGRRLRPENVPPPSQPRKIE